MMQMDSPCAEAPRVRCRARRSQIKASHVGCAVCAVGGGRHNDIYILKPPAALRAARQRCGRRTTRLYSSVGRTRTKLHPKRERNTGAHRRELASASYCVREPTQAHAGPPTARRVGRHRQPERQQVRTVLLRGLSTLPAPHRLRLSLRRLRGCDQAGAPRAQTTRRCRVRRRGWRTRRR